MTYDEIKAAWNAQADEHNQWDDLGEDEKVEWAARLAAAKTAQLATVTAALEQDEPLPPPSIHAAAHYGTWLGREAHRHDEPRAGAFRNAARMLAVLESEVRRLHEELLAAQAQEAAPAAPQPPA